MVPSKSPAIAGISSDRFGTVAAASFGWFIAALLLLHVLKSDYTIIDHMISDYAVGRFGWVMTLAFSGLAFGCFTLALGLILDGPRSLWARFAEAFILITSAGLVVTAIFHTDLETAPSTTSGNIHTLSFLVNVVSMLLASVCLAIGTRADSRWRAYFPTALIFSLLLVIAFVVQFFTLHRGAPYGLTNRLFVTLLMLWLLSTALHLRKLKQAE